MRGFYCVAETGSVRRAAIAMGQGQPTISRQIKLLEKELGVTLFDRSSGNMLITPEGKKLQEDAVTLFEYVKHIKGEFKNEQINYGGKISIAATTGVTYSILPPYIDQFRRLHPDVTFQFEGITRETVYEKVESAEADFGIAVFDKSHSTLVCHDLFEAGLIMIAPKNNPYFSGKALPTLQQIAKVPLIRLAHHGVFAPLIEERFAKDGLKPNVVMTHNNYFNIKQYVALGMGVAIIGEHAVSQEDEQSFDIYNMEPYFPKLKYVIILKKKKYLAPMVKEFIRTIKPDIEFSANLEPSDVPALSLTNLLQKRVGMNQAESSPVKTGRGKKR